MGQFDSNIGTVSPLINVQLPGIQMPTLSADGAMAKAKATLDQRSRQTLQNALNRTMKYQTKVTRDTSLADMATRLGIDSNQLLEWNTGAENGFKAGSVVNLNLTNDLGIALMKSVDELRAENERRAAAQQQYIDENQSALKGMAFMNGLKLDDLQVGSDLNRTYNGIIQDTNLREDANALEHENWLAKQSIGVKTGNFENHLERNRALGNPGITDENEQSLIRQYLQDPYSEDGQLFAKALQGELIAENPLDTERYRNINNLAKKYQQEIEGTEQIQLQLFTGDIRNAMDKAGEYGLKFAGAVGGAMALPTLAADLGLLPVMRLGYNLGKDMILHPIQNIIAPQLASKGIETGIDLTNKAGLTDISDKNKELISTYGGFSLGGLGVGAAKNYISRQMLSKGMGAMFESGSEGLVSNILKNQLESKYMSLAQAGVNPQALAKAGSSTAGNVARQQLKNVGVWSGTNFLNYGVPTLAPGLGQYVSYNYNDKSLGENLEDLTGIDSTVGDFVTEGLLGSAGLAYKHGLAYTQASMSGGKKGFWNNWNYFWDNAGRTEADLKYTDKHPILGKLNSVRRMLTLSPGENNYQMAVTETTGKGHGSTNYRPEENNLKSPLKYVRYWFSGNSDDLGGKLERRGQIMLGNKDTSTGNPLEKLVKSVGVNDGRFENGQIASIVTTPGSATEDILASSHFLNMRSLQFEPMFLQSGEINPNLRFGVTGSRNNTLLADATKNASGTHTGTMLDIDGHMEIPIRTKDGKMMYVAVDTTGPGSGGKGGGVGTKVMSNTTSRELKPAFSVTLSGERRLHGNPDSFGISDVDKIMAPVAEANTDRNFVLTLENMDNANVKAMFGNTPEYLQLAAYRTLKRADVQKAVAEANKRSPKFTWFGKDKPHPFKVEQNIDPNRTVSLRSLLTSVQSKISLLQSELLNGTSGKTNKKLTLRQSLKKQELIDQLQRKSTDLTRAINFVQNQGQSKWSLDYWKNRRAYSRILFNTTRAKADIYTGAKKSPGLIEPAHRGIQVSYKQGGKIGINQIGI